VAVTGIGLVTPLGPDRELSWKSLLAGNCAAAPGGAWAPFDELPEPRALRFAKDAAGEALLDAGVDVPLGERTGILVSCSKPLMDSPLILPGDSVPHVVAWETGAGGPVMNLSAACATGAQSVMAAAEWILEGRCDAALAGAAEASLLPLYVAGFQRMGVLSPSGVVRPFDRRRDGFIMGEGAGVLYLERESSARRRGAHIYGLLSGWHFGCDATDAVRMNGGGRWMAGSLAGALRRAGWDREDLDYVNAHGTATRLNDGLETLALESVYDGAGRRPLVSSTKGATGHLLGATGAIELAFCLLAMRDGRVPPTLHLDQPESSRFDFVPNTSRTTRVRRSASLSFGFGGSLAAVVMEGVS
jgi:3-oxoacyl-[acyl-carrier-protein] synthase II